MNCGIWLHKHLVKAVKNDITVSVFISTFTRWKNNQSSMSNFLMIPISVLLGLYFLFIDRFILIFT